MSTLSYYCALVALVSDYLDVTSYELALVSVTHSAGAPNDQFVVKCIIIPQLMKINVIKAF